MTSIDPWKLYSGLRDEVVELASSLPPDQLEQAVPLTPGWSNAQVVAHLCGLLEDVHNGVREGLGTDQRTRRQVSDRDGQRLAEICAEWAQRTAEFQAVVKDEPALGLRLSADLVVHLHDMQHGLGLPIDPNSAGSMSGGNTYASRAPDRLVEVGNVALTIELSDGNRYRPAVETTAARSITLRTTPYDFLRSVTGRRSTAEVARLDWSEDPGELLDVFSPYGPLRSDDAGA